MVIEILADTRPSALQRYALNKAEVKGQLFAEKRKKKTSVLMCWLPKVRFPIPAVEPIRGCTFGLLLGHFGNWVKGLNPFHPPPQQGKSRTWRLSRKSRLCFQRTRLDKEQEMFSLQLWLREPEVEGRSISDDKRYWVRVGFRFD